MTRQAGAVKQRLRKRSSSRARALQSRVALAKELATTATTTVTLRVPTGLNDWLDGYVHGAWPERVRKQELVTEALRMLIGRRGGPGQEFLDTELLGDGTD